MRIAPPKLLDVKLMGTILDETYVEKINAGLLNMSADNINYYNQYLVLYPLQKLLSLKERWTG